MAARGSTQTFIPLRSKTTGEWFVHPELRPRMLADAQAQGTNLTDLANQILARHFGVPYTPRTRKSNAGTDDVLNIGISPELERAIGAAYPKHRMDGIRYVLCAHYGLAVPLRRKQVRRRRPRAAAA